MTEQGGTGSTVSCPQLGELPATGRREGKGWPWTEETPPLARGTCPTITIITPSLDQSRFLERAMRSVLLQGYPVLEYMVLDGGSTDGSVEIIRKYERWISHWRSSPDRGQSAAINEGLARARGDIVGWLNSDDTFVKGALQEVAKAHEADPEAVAYCGTGLNVDERGRPASRVEPHGLTKGELARGAPNLIFQPACFMKTEAFRRAGGVDEGMTCAFDFDLWMRLADLGRLRKVDAELAEATIHDEAKTQKWADLSIAEDAVALMRHGYEAEAIGCIRRRMKPYLDLALRVQRISANPFYRLAVRPFLRLLGLVGRKRG